MGILFHAKIKNKQTNKQDKKLHNHLETEKSQMNINFFRLFIKCFWWLLVAFETRNLERKRKNYTEQLLTFLWAYMYTIKHYTSRKNKTNKQTNYTSSNQE